VVYLDNCIICALAKDDTPDPSLDRLCELIEQGQIKVCTSKHSLVEIQRCSRQDLMKTSKRFYSILSKVPYIEDHKHIGQWHLTDHIGTWISNPQIEEHPTAWRLRELLDRDDAHHLMIAIEAGCSVFLTLDRNTILNKRVAIEKEFPIGILHPRELAAEFSL
jgi:predicted nucleic acid-binding protein